MSKPTLLILGPGYIGGSLIVDLLKLDKYEITVFLRKPEQAQVLEKLGVKSVLGDRTDLKLIESTASKYDIIINLLSSEFPEIVTAIGAGVNAHPLTSTGQPKIFIHVGGGGVFGSHFRQNDPHAVYSDNDQALIDSLPDSAPHRVVDLALVAVHKVRSGAKIIAHIPTTVFGEGYGPFNKLSLQLPIRVKLALRDGYVSYGEDGKTVFPQIHVADVNSSFIVLLDALLSDKIDVSVNPYIIATNDLLETWGAVADQIAKSLVETGVWPEPVTKSVGKADFFGHYGARSDRLKALGWSAASKETVLEAVAKDVQSIVAARQIGA